jgi:short subunit fatty acids transporter
MPLPAILPILGGAVGGLTVRGAATAVLGWGMRLVGATFRSKLAWTLAGVWATQAVVRGKADFLPAVAAVKNAYAAIVAWADGKVIGAFPPAMQPTIAFINYHVPLSETIFILTALCNLYLLCHALIFAIWSMKKLHDLSQLAQS